MKQDKLVEALQKIANLSEDALPTMGRIIAQQALSQHKEEGWVSGEIDDMSITALLSKYQHQQPKKFGDYMERQYTVSAVIEIIRMLKGPPLPTPPTETKEEEKQTTVSSAEVSEEMALKILSSIGYDNNSITATEIWITKELHKKYTTPSPYNTVKEECPHGVSYRYDCEYCRLNIEPYNCKHGIDSQLGCPDCNSSPFANLINEGFD